MAIGMYRNCNGTMSRKIAFPAGQTPQRGADSDVNRVFCEGAGFIGFWLPTPKKPDTPIRAAALPAWFPSLARALRRGDFVADPWRAVPSSSLRAFAAKEQEADWVVAACVTPGDGASPDIPRPLWVTAACTHGPLGQRAHLLAAESREVLEAYIEINDVRYRRDIDFDLAANDDIRMRRAFERRATDRTREEIAAERLAAEELRNAQAKEAASGFSDMPHNEDRDYAGGAEEFPVGNSGARERMNSAAEAFKKVGVRDEGESGAGTVLLDTKGAKSRTGKLKAATEKKKRRAVAKMKKDDSGSSEEATKLDGFLQHRRRVNASAAHTPSAIRRAGASAK
jgi:hypothetical protein